MTKRIRHVSELPEWFKLEKYEDAKDLNITGWYQQLVIRKSAIVHVKNVRQEALDLIRNNPIIDIKNNFLFWAWFHGGAQQRLHMDNPHFAIGVHSLTVNEFLNIEDSLLPEKLNYARGWRKNPEKCCPRSEPNYPYEHWIDQPVYNSAKPDHYPCRALYVNLGLPDVVLIEHFKECLTKLRIQSNTNHVVKYYRKLDTHSWIKYGILPYLDLIIWGKEMDVTIPNRVMADAIYPHGMGGEETVRKTTSELASALTDQMSLNQLASQAALEISEGLNK